MVSAQGETYFIENSSGSDGSSSDSGSISNCRYVLYSLRIFGIENQQALIDV